MIDEQRHADEPCRGHHRQAKRRTQRRTPRDAEVDVRDERAAAHEHADGADHRHEAEERRGGEHRGARLVGARGDGEVCDGCGGEEARVGGEGEVCDGLGGRV